jgi:hypothetical protein
MKLFIRRTLFFCLLALLSFGSTVVLNYFLVKNTNLSFNKEKSILLLGDSNMQCALDDAIVPNSVNFAESSESYFYTYLKLKKIRQSTSSIDTVLLSFSPHNIIDNRWLFSKHLIGLNLRHYYPLMSIDDFVFLFNNNPEAVIGGLKEVPYQLLRNITKKIKNDNIFDLGRFVSLKKNNTDKHINLIKDGKKLPFFELPESFKISNQEIIYLNKIILFCDQYKIKLILINTPKRKELLDYKNYYVNDFNKFYLSNFIEIPFYDFSSMPIPKEYHADLVHLNYKGAMCFSTMIKVKGFSNLCHYLK